MSAIPFKKRMIYLQIILFLLGSFSLLIQGTMDSSGHLFSTHASGGKMEHMSMQMDVLAGPVQLNHGKADGKNACCDNCNCANHNCSVNCSMFHFMAASINIAGSVFSPGSKPAASVPLLVGIYKSPEQPPPELFLI